MTDAQLKQLCFALIKADTEEEVVQLLSEAGFWDMQAYWRYYGDYENNYNTAGNQQARPDPALVEKLINSVDARLMNECLARGIDPTGNAAPASIREAVAMFFEDGAAADKPHAGQIKFWPLAKRTQIARGITLAATGAKPPGKPCFSIADSGEGQTPEKMSDTLVSLNKSNKLRIPFVQGKFNMGGTGVLKFCGKRNLQLIVTRRNPAILRARFDHSTDSHWGFTVVRREDPGDGRRSSVYTYLAPVGVLEKKTLPGQGGVLRFTADKMPIFPDGQDPYRREAEWGTLIKLYEYDAVGFRSNIISSRGGLLSRMDLLLPEVGLPVRLHECRSYEGHEGSFETTLTGVGVRLEDDRGNNLEDGFPSSCPLSAAGQEMTATIYAFRKGRAETYRRNEGIIFTLNGQTHGHLTPDFFRRTKTVGLSYLADSLLVVVDCTRFSGRAREDLFMNSRDRLSGGELRQELEEALEEMLKQHQGLRALKERRRREETEEKFADSKPLENILESLLKKSEVLASLFLRGNRASNPFKSVKVQEEEMPYQGKTYPTFFKFMGKEYGEELHRETAKNMRSRIMFETDAVNDFFSRSIDPGQFALWMESGDKRQPVRNYVGPNLQNGSATLSVQLPDDCNVGDELWFVAVVTDPTRVEAFENRFSVTVKRSAEASGSSGTRRKPPTKNLGGDRHMPSGITLPHIKKVHEEEWQRYSPPFDKYTALRIKGSGAEEPNGNGEVKSVYDFYVNMDNLYLRSEMKPAGTDAEILRNRFVYGNVLVGLALLHQDELDKKLRSERPAENEEEEQAAEVNIEDRVEQLTRAVAPVLLPMIESLGGFELEEPLTVDGSGEAT